MNLKLGIFACLLGTIAAQSWAGDVPLLRISANKPEYVEGHRMALNIQAITDVIGEPKQSWWVIAKHGNPAVDIPLTRLGDGHWTLSSGQLKFGVNATVTVDLYLEPEGLSAEWREALFNLDHEIEELVRVRDAATDPGEVETLQHRIDQKSRIRNSLLRVLLQNQLPIEHASYTPVILQDVDFPVVTDLIRDASSGILADHAVTETNQVRISWEMTDNGVADSQFKFQGLPYSFEDLGDGRYEAVIDVSTFQEESANLEITSTDFAGNKTLVLREVRIDRLPPRLTLTMPQNCFVEKTSSHAFISGSLSESNVERFDVTQFDGAHPLGQKVSVTLQDGLYSADPALSIGDNRFEVVAVDKLGRVSSWKVQQAYFPAGAPVSYNVIAATDDTRPLDGLVLVNGVSATVPGRVFVQGPSTFVFRPGGRDSGITFQGVLDPLFRYTYTASTGVWDSIPDGCRRTLSLVYPSVVPLPAVEILIKDGSGAAVNGAVIEYKGQQLEQSIVRVPEGVSFDLVVRYGVSRAKARIFSGANPDETVIYTLSTGQLVRVPTPGRTSVELILEPIEVLVENRSVTGVALNLPVQLVQALVGTDAVIRSSYNGFEQKKELRVDRETDYEVAVHGGRFFKRPSTTPGQSRVTFYYHLAKTALSAVSSDGTSVPVAFKTSGSTSIGGTLPVSFELGLSSSADVTVGRNGFEKRSHVKVFEDEILHVDLAAGIMTRTYAFLKPRIEWTVDPIGVRIEAIDQNGVPVFEEAGTTGADGSSIVTPGAISLLDRTEGRVFIAQPDGRKEFPLQIKKSMLHEIDTVTGALKMTKTADASTQIRFRVMR